MSDYFAKQINLHKIFCTQTICTFTFSADVKIYTFLEKNGGMRLWIIKWTFKWGIYSRIYCNILIHSECVWSHLCVFDKYEETKLLSIHTKTTYSNIMILLIYFKMIYKNANLITWHRENDLFWHSLANTLLFNILHINNHKV